MMARLCVVGLAVLIAVGCGDPAADEPGHDFGDRPQIENVGGEDGASPVEGPRLFNAKGGGVEYEDPSGVGSIYHTMVVNPQVKALEVQLVTPLQRSIQAYYIENDKYPNRLEDIGEGELAPIRSRIPPGYGMRYDNRDGKITFIRWARR